MFGMENDIESCTKKWSSASQKFFPLFYITFLKIICHKKLSGLCLI